MNPVDKILGSSKFKRLIFDRTSNNFSVFKSKEQEARERYWASLAEMQRREEQRIEEGRRNTLPYKQKAEIIQQHNISPGHWNKWSPPGYGIIQGVGATEQPSVPYPLRQGEVPVSRVTNPQGGRQRPIMPDVNEMEEFEKKFAMKGATVYPRGWWVD